MMFNNKKGQMMPGEEPEPGFISDLFYGIGQLFTICIIIVLVFGTVFRGTVFPFLRDFIISRNLPEQSTILAGYTFIDFAIKTLLVGIILAVIVYLIFVAAKKEKESEYL